MLDTRRRIVIAALIALALAAAGCSDIDPFDSTSTAAPSRHRPDDANDADVEFLKDMIDHLQSGKALTSAALDSRSNAGDDVATLAAHVEDEDAGRVDKMTELLDIWGETTAPTVGAEPVGVLFGLKGPEFDRQWTALMLAHHAQAEDLAKRVKRNGSSRAVNNLATGMLIDLGFETSRIDSV